MGAAKWGRGEAGAHRREGGVVLRIAAAMLEEVVPCLVDRVARAAGGPSPGAGAMADGGKGGTPAGGWTNRCE